MTPPALTKADLILLLEIGIREADHYFVRRDTVRRWEKAREHLTHEDGTRENS